MDCSHQYNDSDNATYFLETNPGLSQHAGTKSSSQGTRGLPPPYSQRGFTDSEPSTNRLSVPAPHYPHDVSTAREPVSPDAAASNYKAFWPPKHPDYGAERLSFTTFGADLEPTDTKSRSLEVDVEHHDSDSTSLKVDLEPAYTKWRSLKTDSSLRAPGPEDKFLPTVTEVAVNAVHVRAGDTGAAGSSPDDLVGILRKAPAKRIRTISDESGQLTTRELTCSFTAALLSLCCGWPCSCCALVCSWRAQRQTYEGKHLDARRSFRMSTTLTIISVAVWLVGLLFVLQNAGII
ncbi:uncharacterized protein [Littorina saxatilis]|uniref:Uncharacterized protein n=1 Tax=Littorina saxatilis TaxID=31220 RepID=A0AAN9GNU5_9CAEN